jgi:hypothetical protein
MNPRDLKGRVARLLPVGVRESVRRRRFGRARPWDPDFDLTPPPHEAGHVFGPPDFVGVGAQKAGTSWWFAMIMQHPGCYGWGDAHKERHYFDRFWGEDFGPERVTEYHRWFPRPPGTRTGEWTPQYLFHPWSLPLLQRAAPEARILVMLRDPIERYRSGLTHFSSRAGWRDARAATDAFYRGLYAAQLEILFRSFDRGQVLVLQYEQCRREPSREIGRTYDFLGLDQSFTPSTTKEINVTRSEKIALPHHVRVELTLGYEDDIRRLQSLWPALDVSLWPNFAHLG